MADGAERDVIEQLDHAGTLEQRAEQDEQEDEGRRNEGRRAVDAFGAEIQHVDDLLQVKATMHHEIRQAAAEQRVRNEDRADQRQFPAHDAARAFHHQQNDDDADHEVGQDRIAGSLDQVAFKDPVIEGQHEAGHAKRPVIPRRAV
jgi:hypothetical protein